MPLLQQVLGQQLTVNAIVDANAVYRVLFWRLKTRQKSDARTTLEEALDSGVLVLIAPHFLKDEIDEKLSIIAAQTSSTPLEVRREWEQLEQKLRFYRPLGRAAVTKAADPDDLPYKFASDELGLPIYTRDKHLKQMGAPIIRVYIDTTLRDHARAMSVTLTTAVGSTYSVVVGVATLKAAGRGIKNAFNAFRRFPEWLQWTIAGALVAIAIHPRSRAKLLEMGRSFASPINEAKGSV